MEGIIKHIWIHIIFTGLPYLIVIRACDLATRINRTGSDVTVSQTELPCKLTLTARRNKQVVVVMYDAHADCVEKATVAIYDGNDTKDNLLTDICQTQPWSFASRNHSLTLTPVSDKPTKPLRPFRLDIHTFETFKNYTTPTDSIRSERFNNYLSRFTAKTSPNNIHAFYEIKVEENVTIKVHFVELNVQAGTGGPCIDFVKVHSIEPAPELCGENTTTANITTNTDKLLIEFKTDNLITYTGFEARYVACFGKRQVSNRTGNFKFPIYRLADKMRCYLDLNFEEEQRVEMNIYISSNLPNRGCKNIIKIIADGKDVTDEHFTKCSKNEEIAILLSPSRRIRLLFTSEDISETARGNYTTDFKLSAEEDVDKEEQVIGKEDNTMTIITIATAVSFFVIFIAILALVTVIIRRKKEDSSRKHRIVTRHLTNRKEGNFKAGEEEVDIYESNEDYDTIHTQRKHKATPNDDEIYGKTYGPSDVYAAVSRKHGDQRRQTTNEYGDHRVENVYDKAEQHRTKETK